MLQHLLSDLGRPARAVILGAGGFIGEGSVRSIGARGIETLSVGRSDVDLLASGADAALRALLRPDDTLVVISARAPCKDAAMLIENIRMAQTVGTAIRGAALGHLVYVSSDAVYKDSPEPISESSCAEPGSIHGAMHLAREVLLRAEYAGPMAILRPTLVYGIDDPHNGYGPNRFRRLASSGKDIVLFGEGEERRDHIHVEDVAGLIGRIVQRRSVGILNAVSGEVASFRELAELTASQFTPRVTVAGSPRAGAMPHNGYRPFDPSAIARAFPEFRITPWRDGIANTCKQQLRSPAP